jgi:DNA-binding NtrC family response regulator
MTEKDDTTLETQQTFESLLEEIGPLKEQISISFDFPEDSEDDALDIIQPIMFYMGRGKKFTWGPDAAKYEVHSNFVETHNGQKHKLLDIEGFKQKVHQCDWAQFEESLRALAHEDTNYIHPRIRIYLNDNEWMVADWHVVVMGRSEKGKPTGIAGWIRLFSEERLLDQEIHEAATMIRGLIESMSEEGIEGSGLLRLSDFIEMDESISDEMTAWLYTAALVGNSFSDPVRRRYCFVKDLSMKYAYVSPGVADLYGRSASELLGCTDGDLFSEHDEIFEAEIIDALMDGASVNIQNYYKLPDDDQYVNEVLRAVPHLASGAPQWVLGIITHIVKGDEEKKDPDKSSAMAEVYAEAEKVAQVDSIVLITGESGSGKDYLARFIHDKSKRCNGPYLSLNCAAITHELAESELFGHEEGAFTGAGRRKKGLIELADGGTLLLNEVGELSPALQAKLLSYLDTKSFIRVGGEKTIKPNVRLLAATNKDLEKEVEAGRFRHDLFFRLNVEKIRVPPLRERKAYLSGLVKDLLQRLAVEMDLQQAPRIDPKEVQILKAYEWPGNVRELRNVLERAIIKSSDNRLDLRSAMPAKSNETIISEENDWTLTGKFKKSKSGEGLFNEVLRSLIEEALKKAKGNKTQAARLLGVSLPALKSKLKTLGITGSK